MAINTSWKVEIGTVASPTNFTSRVMGMSIDQSVDVNVVGRGICRITLLNKDGALTPGGGGTYSNTDWFAQGVFVSALTNTGGADTTTTVFHGVVVDFDLVDDGVYSTVTITSVDGLTIGGKSTPPTVPVTSTTYQTALAVALDTSSFGALYMPQLGNSSVSVTPTFLNSENPSIINDASQSFNSYADVWQTGVIPSANDVLWPTTITNSAGITLYAVRSNPMTNTRDTATRVDFVFDPSTSISGSDLPFLDDNFQQAFNNDTLISQAVIKGNYTGAASVTSTASTVNSYGSRTVEYTKTFVANATAATDMATKLTNRYSVSRFTPVSLSLSASLVKSRCADAAKTQWESLLSITSGLWQKAIITWTGSGVSQQTANAVIKGRRIEATPQDTIVTLTLGNWVDNHGFILDTDMLDTDRLG